MKVTSIAFTEAKAQLSRYGRMAAAGQTILVRKHNRSAFVIAPLPREEMAREKKPGLARGRIHPAPDFDRTPEDVIQSFEGLA